MTLFSLLNVNNIPITHKGLLLEKCVCNLKVSKDNASPPNLEPLVIDVPAMKVEICFYVSHRYSNDLKCIRTMFTQKD